MGGRPDAVPSPEYAIGATGSALVKPDEVFDRVVNFFPTEEGGLRSVYAPTPYVPRPVVGGPPLNASPPNPLTPTYSTTYGLFHCRVREGERELLLLQTEDQVWEFEGWNRQWRRLISSFSTGSAQQANLPIPAPNDYPTQFVATPTGVVIIPPRGRAYFYDGIAILPLGYDHAPGPPIGLGPESSASTFWPDGTAVPPVFGVNDTGYAMDSLDCHYPSFMYPVWRQGRVGTIDTPGDMAAIADDTTDQAVVMGFLMPGRWRARVQWIDRWGNLSPLSPESNDVRFKRQPAMGIPGVGGIPVPAANPQWVHADKVLKQVAWDSISIGPEGTIGRLVGRTKDLENSGDVRCYELPSDSMVVEGKFATMQDNSCTTYPDNIPDAWLANEMVEVDPIPAFRLAALAFGRLWMAKEGTLYWSMVGKWGTIAKGSSRVPDPSAAEITGLHPVARGLLVFTERSTYLIEANAAGDDFRAMPLSSTMGCVAPSSIVTVRDGVTIWLGDDGFYGFDGVAVKYIFDAHRQSAKRHNRARLGKAVASFDVHSGEYRCWVAVNGRTVNNRCWCFDGKVWRQRNDVFASGSCVTGDHRKLHLVSGVVDGLDGVWVMDHGGAAASGTLTTGWWRSTRSRDRSTTRRVFLKLRETGIPATADDKITVSVRVDYRAEVVGTQVVNTYPAPAEGYGTTPDAWGSAVFGAATWRRRRPYEAKADIHVPSSEVFQIELTCPARYEVYAVSFEEAPRPAAGASSWK